jgi:AraC family transcriptional regulator of adaptative response / DNA-3-methyladenine glycosylase II
MLEQAGLTRDVLDRARRSRDARFDGKFFIAVTSTRIYCRPICPAKTSRDSNVHYYATAAEAAAAGFRPCLRCRPESAPGSPAWMGTSAVVRRALRLIQDGALDEHSIEEIALRLGVGARHLHRLFTRHLGASPLAIARTRRLHFSKQLLDETDLPVTEVALASGFRSVRRFNDAFKAMYRRPPREIRRRLRAGRLQGADAEIRLRLTYRPPYEWRQVLRFLERGALKGVEVIQEGMYARTVRTSSGAAILEVHHQPHADALELRLRGGESSDLLPISSSVRRMFDLSADPARIASILARDAELAPLLARRPGLRIPGTWDAFESGVRAILLRGSDETKARGLLDSIVARFGDRVSRSETSLDRIFPTPQRLSAADIESAGLDARRARALRRFARAVWDGTTRLDGSQADLAGVLAGLPGLDSWVAGYVALRGLGEPDAFPEADPMLMRGPAALALTPRALHARAELWRPFRGYAVLHLWEASEARAEPSRSGELRHSDARFEVRGQPVRTAPCD